MTELIPLYTVIDTALLHLIMVFPTCQLRWREHALICLPLPRGAY